MDYPVKEAYEAREFAYAPYSGFRVGAALKCKNGKIYKGCNIENASYPVTVCAERVALSKAVSEGEKEFECIVIVGSEGLCPPCGMCRQALAEFCNGDFEVVLTDEKKIIKVYKLKELLPLSFSLKKV